MRKTVLANCYGILSRPTLVYSAELHREIADDIVAIDQAMKWGFGWEQDHLKFGMQSALKSLFKNGRRRSQCSALGERNA